jgi:hypothetical protein
MSFTSIDEVLGCVTRLTLVRMMARDSEGNTVDSAETETSAAMCERIDEMVRNHSGILRIEAWQAAPVRQVGQTKAEVRAKVERLSWRVRGTFGNIGAAAPSAPAPAEKRADAAPVVQGMTIEQAVAWARTQWEIERLRAENEELLRDLEYDDAEPDEPPVPSVPSTLFGMTGEQTFAVLDKLMDRMSLLGLKQVAAPIASPIQGIPAQSAPTDIDPETLAAFRRMMATQPAMAAEVVANLKATFPPDAA